MTKWFIRARVEACETNTPPPGPGRAVSIPRISSSRMASLIVASATPKRRRRSSFVPRRWPGWSSPPVMSASSSRAIASPSEMREWDRNELTASAMRILSSGVPAGRTYHVRRRPTAVGGPLYGRQRSGVHGLEHRVRAQALAGQLGTHPPVVEHEHAPADRLELVEVGRGHEHDGAGRCDA